MKVSNTSQLETLKGKQASVYCTGLIVTGAIIEVDEDQYSFGFTVQHRAVQWGDQELTQTHVFQRKCDGWGSMKNAKILK